MRRVGAGSDETSGTPAGAGAISQQLVIRFVAGDNEAFEQIFEALKHNIFNVVRRFFQRPFDQEEAFQEAWLQLYRMRDRFDVDRYTELNAWTRQVARNRCLDLLKASRRNREVPVEELNAHAEADQGAAVRSSRMRQAVEQFAEGLDPDQKRFFKLCFVQEHSHEQIARQLRVTIRRSKYLKKKLIAKMLKSPALRRAHREG